MRLTIGNPVKRIRHQEQYKLSVTCMHGDGDAYTTEERFYNWDDTQELINVLELFAILKTKPAGFRKYQPIVDEFSESKGLDKDIFADLIFGELISDDHTSYNGHCAILDTYKVTWFDEKAIEHEVKIEL
jgi:hypothetical protein